MIDLTAMFSIGYGLYVLTSHDGSRDCGCIVNGVMQLTEKPLRVAISSRKVNHTCDAIAQSGKFALSVLTEETTMDVVRHFGYQSGRDVDKFADLDAPYASNGMRYLTGPVNTVIAGTVEQAIDCGTHMLFICAVTQAEKLSDAPSLTYAYYQSHIKPKPQPKPKKGYVCRVCGYFHEGDELPEDFICPICKHGAEAFDAVGF